MDYIYIYMYFSFLSKDAWLVFINEEQIFHLSYLLIMFVKLDIIITICF